MIEYAKFSAGLTNVFKSLDFLHMLHMLMFITCNVQSVFLTAHLHVVTSTKLHKSSSVHIAGSMKLTKKGVKTERQKKLFWLTSIQIKIFYFTHNSIVQCWPIWHYRFVHICSVLIYAGSWSCSLSYFVYFGYPLTLNVNFVSNFVSSEPWLLNHGLLTPLPSSQKK